jgi:hypothetical protein
MGEIKKKKKLKKKYTKIILFKIYKYDCKSDERSVVINKVSHIFNFMQIIFYSKRA